MPDLIRHPVLETLKHHWIPGQARNDKRDTYFPTITGTSFALQDCINATPSRRVCKGGCRYENYKRYSIFTS